MLLVTGAAGHTGRRFLQALAAAKPGSTLRCLLRDPEQAAAFAALDLDVEVCVGDLSDAETLVRATSGVRTVLHLATIGYSEALVQAGTRAGVDWFILMHTTGRFSRHRSAAAVYAGIEDALIATHRNLTILRPTMIYGSSMDHNMRKLIAFLDRFPVFPVFGGGRNLLQPVDARDLGQACLQVLQNRDRVIDRQYDLPGADSLSYLELLRTIRDQLGRRTRLVPVPLWTALLSARVLAAVLGARTPVTVEQVQRISEDKAFAWADAARDFGYAPRRFADGIALEIAEYRARQTPDRR